MNRLPVARHAGRTFDWTPKHDERSRMYAVRDIVEVAPTKPLWWAGGAVLDQGREGACAGFAAAAEAAASPARVAGVTDAYARGWYQRAKELDEWRGEDYDGTSVNGTMKVGRERGMWDSYHWAFGVDDVRKALLLGPVVIGIPWFEGLYETRGSQHEMVADGELVGGHCILVTGWAPSFGRLGATFRLRNSWGPSFGKNGNGYMRRATLAALLEQDGEAAVPTDRHKARIQ